MRFHAMAPGELRASRRLGRSAGVLEHRYVAVPDLRELEDMGPAPSLAGLPPSYIPMKNAVYYSFAAAFAEETGASVIIGGHNGDDGEVFEDTSAAFFEDLQAAFRVGSSRLRKSRLRIWTPLSSMKKAEVVRLGDRLGVPFEMTWSCHQEGRKHCWSCHGCLQRVQAFETAGVKDPLLHV